MYLLSVGGLDYGHYCSFYILLPCQGEFLGEFVAEIKLMEMRIIVANNEFECLLRSNCLGAEPFLWRYCPHAHVHANTLTLSHSLLLSSPSSLVPFFNEVYFFMRVSDETSNGLAVRLTVKNLDFPGDFLKYRPPWL